MLAQYRTTGPWEATTMRTAVYTFSFIFIGIPIIGLLTVAIEMLRSII